MALFLQESTQVAPRVSLDTALLGLLEFTQEFAAFNESVLRADFIIHEQSKTLTEEAAEEKKAGLLKRAGSKLVEMFKKLKEMIKRVWAAVVARFKALWAKITGANGKLKVNKAKLERLNKASEAFDKLGKAVSAKPASAEAYSKAVAEAKEAFDKEAAVDAQGGEAVAVKASELGAIQKAMTIVIAKQKNAEAQINAMIAQAEKVQSDEKSSADDKKSAGEEHGKLVAQKTGVSTLAQAATRLFGLASQAVQAGAANTPEEKKE
jgi:hypothetical protein